jgi:hypothetical protein
MSQSTTFPAATFYLAPGHLVHETLLPQETLNGRPKRLLRWVLFVYLMAVLRPIRYWEFIPKNEDNTWLFVLNLAVHGRDIVWSDRSLTARLETIRVCRQGA